MILRKNYMIFVVFVILALVTPLLFATGQKEEGAIESQEGETAVPEGVDSWKVDTSKVNIELYVDAPGDWGNYWDNEPVSKKWMKETGVNLNINTAPDSSHQQLNVLIASGDIPDMVLLKQELPQSKTLADNNAIWALDELSKKQAPGFYSYMYDDNTHIVLHQRMLFDSMHFYLAPFRHLPEKYFDSPYAAKNLVGTVVLENIYKEIGSPTIESAEDYINMLKEIKDKYPDMIPMQSYRSPDRDVDGNPQLIQYLLPVAGLQQKYFKKSDGSWYKYWEHENFPKLLKLANTLYNEELVRSEEFTTASESDLRANLYNGKVFSELAEDANNIDTHTTYLQEQKPGWKWKMLDGFTIEPREMEYAWDTLKGGFGSWGLFIPKNSDKAVRSIRFLDFIYQDETQMELMFGLKGDGYELRDGLPFFTPDALKAFNSGGRSAVASKYGARAYYIFRDDYWGKASNVQMASENQAEAWKIANSNYEDLSFYMGAEMYPLNSEEQKVAANIKDYYETAITKIIMASPNQVGKLYNEMMETLKDLGLSSLNDFWTEYFNSKSEKREKYSAGLNLN